jgi:GMP synthase-like glutamine amidotransferase
LRRFLIAEGETAEQRDERRSSAGKSSGETYAATLRQMAPDAQVDLIYPSDADAYAVTIDAITAYDAVFLSGSPMHVYHESPEVDRQLSFMASVYASGTPSFGSCAGLQVATVAAGGTVRRMPRRMEAGIARKLSATPAGQDHPLLRGRPVTWDAPAIHGDEVAELPPCATLLATNTVTAIQAVEIRYDRSVFWGVQYHPELAPGEIAAALRRQAADLIGEGLARYQTDVEHQAALFDILQHDDAASSARWQLGVDDQFAVEKLRRTELWNFLSEAPNLRQPT